MLRNPLKNRVDATLVVYDAGLNTYLPYNIDNE